MREFFCNKVILVTGAAGSVGQELVNQLLSVSPAEVRAMDNMGNRSQQVFNIEVGEEGRLHISNVFPYPNPFEDGTYLIYDLSRDADVTVRIFTVAGHPVRKIEAGYQASGQQSVYWDGRDEEMDEVANGAYLFRVDARSGGGSANALGKAMRVR